MMNLVRNKSLHPHLRDDEALVVENAIRLAIDSIINVLYGVNSARTHEHQRMVADRDKEIQRLERKVREAEHELKVLRRQGCSSSMLFEDEHSLVTGSQSSSDPREREQSGFEPSCMDPEMTAVQQECEMSISLGLFARPASHVSSQSHESTLLSSHSGTVLDQTCTSHSSESSGVSDAARNLPTPPSSSVVIKEEPCDIDTVLIKWEMNEERIVDAGETTSSPCQEKESPSVTNQPENRELREKAHTDSGGHSITKGEHLRNKKKSVPMSELPEEVQKLKRAAWRAASRRYYARKVARQQANPLRSASFPHIMDSHYSQPISFVGKRRKTLISELPGDTQTQQREAWRAASRRYYARKMTLPQTDPSQFLLQNMEPTGETLAPNRGESHTNAGGIMCS
ncbi:uncharacterized protein LKV04_006924 [Tautogolabrus adspersus]